MTRITDIPRRRRSESISSRICFWMVTSSAVVGSSAISSFGSQASAIAIITRCRIPPESWCGYCDTRSAGRGMPTRPSTSTARSSASAFDAPRCSRTDSAIWSPMRHRRVERGQRVLEDHSDQVPADVLHAGLRQRGHVRPVHQDPAADDFAAARQQPHDRQRGHRLARARFADDAEALAGRHRQRDAVDRVHGGTAQPDLGAQVLDVEKRSQRKSPQRKRNQRRCRRTSNESRSASPMKLIAMTTRMIAMPAGKICHQ